MEWRVRGAQFVGLDIHIFKSILVKDVYATPSVHQDLCHLYALYDCTDHQWKLTCLDDVIRVVVSVEGDRAL
jgi:hypothetical protein